MNELYQRTQSLIGIEAIEKLKKSHVAVFGLGGVGGYTVEALARAGVGKLTLIDNDTVNESNLNRQILYEDNDEGKWKVDAAACKIKKLNRRIHINIYPEKITREKYQRAREIVAEYDIVVDACDNMATRYLVSDLTEELSIPFVYGAMEGFCGYVSVFNDGSSYKRFRDLWPDEEEKYPHEIPAIGVTAGVIGSLQANEVIKWICGFGERLAGKLLTIDLCRMEFHLLTI